MVVQVKMVDMELKRSEPIFIRSEIRILVVDDREDNLFSIESILEKDGYTIVKANSGRAALKVLLNQQDFTLILMDVQMPEMDGFETASMIYEREKLKHIPIIFISAQSHDEKYVFEGYKMGAVDYIYKPINPDLLRFKVGVFAELYRKTTQLMEQEKRLIAINSSLAKEIEERKISESKVTLLNQQLIFNNQQLESTIEDLDQFAYVASHDLQEPLRKILLFCDKITSQYRNNMQDDVYINLQKIVGASKRLQQLVSDLLKFSRHAQDLTGFEATNLNHLVQEVLSDIGVEIQNRNAKVVYENLPVIWAIPSQVRQLFQNLISNSLKFCIDDCVPEIHIYSERIMGSDLPELKGKNPDQVYHRIFFKDNGIGFDPRYAEDIFVVFKRLHSYHEYAGTGIGLSICKKIVDKHNGYINAQSQPGAGATFIIALPEKQENLVKLVTQNGMIGLLS
jgi:signal transduction histidine kinase